MPKRFYDIYPPEEKERVVCRDSVAQKSINSFHFRKINSRIVVILAFLFLALLFGFIYRSSYLLIEIIPENVVIDYSGNIKAETNVLVFGAGGKSLPAVSLEVDKQKNMTFSATGKEAEESRAEGVIRVYNNHSTSSQVLVANTRFVSADGKLFRSVQRVTIPGGRHEEGKFIPGNFDVQVRAAEAGDSYNIEKNSKFSIPGFQGTPMYTSFYGENLEPIKGGNIGEVSKITQNDIENARKVLANLIENEVVNEFISQYSSEFALEKELIMITVTEERILTEPEGKSGNFEYEIEATVKMLSFKEKDLITAAKSEMEFEALESGQAFLSRIGIFEESFDYNYEVVEVDFDNGTIALNLNSTAVFYSLLDEELLKEEISLKKAAEVDVALEDYSNILDFNLHFRPSWIKLIPKASKIKIEYKMP